MTNKTDTLLRLLSALNWPLSLIAGAIAYFGLQASIWQTLGAIFVTGLLVNGIVLTLSQILPEKTVESDGGGTTGAALDKLGKIVNALIILLIAAFLFYFW